MEVTEQRERARQLAEAALLDRLETCAAVGVTSKGLTLAKRVLPPTQAEKDWDMFVQAVRSSQVGS